MILESHSVNSAKDQVPIEDDISDRLQTDRPTSLRPSTPSPFKRSKGKKTADTVFINRDLENNKIVFITYENIYLENDNEIVTPLNAYVIDKHYSR